MTVTASHRGPGELDSGRLVVVSEPWIVDPTRTALLVMDYQVGLL
jgi:hypothetical protein